MRISLACEAATSLASAARTSTRNLARLRPSQLDVQLSQTRQFSASCQYHRTLADNGTTATHTIRQTTSSPRAPAPATSSTPSPSPSSTSDAKSAVTNGEEPVARSLTDGLSDPPPVLSEDEKQVDWTRSFHGLSASPFSDAAIAVLTGELKYDDIEIKPDGIVYLPEIKYRRILNKAFGPGGWGLAPRGETIVTGKVVTREYGLVAGGR